MILTGEGGMGKLHIIQSVTECFKRQNIPHKLGKGAYTGIAASLIRGKMLHVLFSLTINQRGMSSMAKIQQLAHFWEGREYLIIDKFLMASQTLFVRISTILGLIWQHNNPGETCMKHWGGVNVIICVDFHQFKTVVQKKTAPLYWPINSLIDNEVEAMGSELFQ